MIRHTCACSLTQHIYNYSTNELQSIVVASLRATKKEKKNINERRRTSSFCTKRKYTIYRRQKSYTKKGAHAHVQLTPPPCLHLHCDVNIQRFVHVYVNLVKPHCVSACKHA